MAGKENKGVFHPHDISKPLCTRGGRAQRGRQCSQTRAHAPGPTANTDEGGVKAVTTAAVTKTQRAARQHAEPLPGPGWAQFTVVDVFSWPLLGGPEVRRLREKPGGQADAGCAPREPRSVARDIKRPPPPPPFLQIWEDVTPTSHTFRRHPAPRTPQVKAEAHLKSVEAAVGLQSEVLGVLQGVNVAVLDDEVAQVLSLWGGAGETRKLRAGAKGSSSPPCPHTAPQTPGRAAPSYQHFHQEVGAAVPDLCCGQVPAGETAPESPPAWSPQ